MVEKSVGERFLLSFKPGQVYAGSPVKRVYKESDERIIMEFSDDEVDFVFEYEDDWWVCSPGGGRECLVRY